MKRREFLKGSLAASAALAALPTLAADAKPAQEFYQLRVYRLKPGSTHELLDSYLEKAALPALNRMGLKPIGVFTETDTKKDPAVYVLIPYASVDSMLSVSSRLKADQEYQTAGADYIKTSKDHPAYARIDTWLLRAFAGIPKLEIPSYSKEKATGRVFEIRTYESYSEAKAQKKVDMFNDGEIDVMREVGLAPIFFGQALVGANLPHLTYMLSAESREAHKQHWDKFGSHPTWKKMSSDPQYADTVSKIYNSILEPTPYSQI